MTDAFASKVFNIVRATRALSAPGWGTAAVKKKKGERGDSVVTEADLAIERMLQSELKKLDPTIDFVGEEYGGKRDANQLWLVDPIDGTAHYARGLPFCTTMLAYIEEGEVRLAAIYDFLTDTLYHAVTGGGAYRNMEPIHVSARSFDSAYLGWESHLAKSENLARYFKMYGCAVPFKTICSGYEFALVASGKLEGRVQFDPYGKDYDYAPGSLLVSEAGGVVANLGVHTYDYRNLDFIAANPSVFAALTEGPDATFPIFNACIIGG